MYGGLTIVQIQGTGIERMISSCKEYGIREPELLEIGDSFRVNLYRPSFGEVRQKPMESSPKSSPKDLLKGLNATQKRILEMVLENPKVTQTFIAEELGITTRAVQRNIKELVENGFVERIGSARGIREGLLCTSEMKMRIDTLLR